MNYQARLAEWASNPNNVAQKEPNGATSYFFGDNSHLQARTLSGTHAHLENKPVRRIKNRSNEVTVQIHVHAADAQRTLAALAKQIRCTGESFQRLHRVANDAGKAMQEFFHSGVTATTK